MKVKIIGAGSAGNHLAYAARQQGWQVYLYDRNHSALLRTQQEIYPTRYGCWDDTIQLCLEGNPRTEAFDLVVIATQAKNHLKLAIEELLTVRPNIILLEKPLAPVGDSNLPLLLQELKQSSTEILVGYNLNLIEISRRACQIIRSGRLGEIKTIDVQFCEHLSYPAKAHPWLPDIRVRDICNSAAGGGACQEQSHALALWLLFAEAAQEDKAAWQGNAIQVRAQQKVQHLADGRYFDESTVIDLTSHSGLRGKVEMDLLADPPIKQAVVTGSLGRLHWLLNSKPGVDALQIEETGRKGEEILVNKTRPDDFYPQMHAIATAKHKEAISFANGLLVHQIIAAAEKSVKSEKIECVST